MFWSTIGPMRQTVWLQSTIPCPQWRRRKARVCPPLWFSMICGVVSTCICFCSMWPSGHTTKCTRVSYFLLATVKKYRDLVQAYQGLKPVFLIKEKFDWVNNFPAEWIPQVGLLNSHVTIKHIHEHFKIHWWLCNFLVKFTTPEDSACCLLSCCTSFKAAFHKSILPERWSMLRPEQQSP